MQKYGQLKGILEYKFSQNVGQMLTHDMAMIQNTSSPWNMGEVYHFWPEIDVEKWYLEKSFF